VSTIRVPLQWYAQAKHLKKVKIKNEMKSEKMRDIEKK
jgi:hypothetical protein